MLQTTVGQALINQGLPKDLRNFSRIIDKKGIGELMQQVAERYPEQYPQIVKHLLDVGKDASYYSGSNSFGLDEIDDSRAADKFKQEIQQEVVRIIKTTPDPEQRNKKIVEAVSKRQKELEKAVYDEGIAEGSPLAEQLIGAGRGKPFNYNSLRGFDGLYVDQQNRPIPFPVFNSYSRGLTPAEYFASSFGARKGIVDVQKGTADSGYLAKQLNQVAHRLLVTEDDSEDPEYTLRGMPVDTDDDDNVGSLLASPVGGYERNEVLTPKILRDIKSKGFNRLLVRSPILGGPEMGGVYAKDVGVRERGGLPPIGDYVGLASGQALAEGMTQGALCLAKGTLVRMEEGPAKPIEDIKVGDKVWGVNEEGRIVSASVISTFIQGVKETFEYTFDLPQGKRKVRCTPDHKFLLGKNTVRQISDVIDTLEVFHTSKEVECFDIEIDCPTHLFTLDNGIVTSNSSKHAGGVAAAGGTTAGFPQVNQLIQVPKHFPGGGAHAHADGTITRIEPAPQGGHYIYIGTEEHYAAPERTLKVKVGDEIEAGDLLTDGMANPAEVTRYKGIGEGRRTFANQLRQAMKEMGPGANRRHVELLARGLIDHVVLHDELGPYVPDDVVPYSALERVYQPREGFQNVPIAKSKGMYLEKPVLHYTIGTQVRPSVMRDLQEFGISNVTAHKEAPIFTPNMVRGVANISKDPDWMTRMIGSGQKRSLLDSVHRGASSNMSGTSFVPAIAGEGFGTGGLTAGWEADDDDFDS
jgi:hypothetical protein